MAHHFKNRTCVLLTSLMLRLKTVMPKISLLMKRCLKTRSSAIVISAVHLWNTVTFPVQI